MITDDELLSGLKIAQQLVATWSKDQQKRFKVRPTYDLPVLLTNVFVQLYPDWRFGFAYNFATQQCLIHLKKWPLWSGSFSHPIKRNKHRNSQNLYDLTTSEGKHRVEAIDWMILQLTH